MNELFKIGVSLSPVLLFLFALYILDSFKLVPVRLLVSAFTAGVIAALVAMVINSQLLAHWPLDVLTFTRYLAPALEESLKVAFLVYLLRSGRVGFLVDAAIFGFAIGTGFAIVENLYYIMSLTSENPLLWVVRGFGTAVIHGSSMAIFGVIAKYLLDRPGRKTLLSFVVAWLVAVTLHSLFNHFALPPAWNTLAVILVFPPLFLLIFRYSEKHTRYWLGSGMDADLAMLESLGAENIGDTPVGRFLGAIRDHFPAEVVVDMFCYLQLNAELSLGAKGTILLRAAGLPPTRDDAIVAKLEEMTTLEKNIGPTGKLALTPFLQNTSQELWQIYVLKQ